MDIEEELNAHKFRSDEAAARHYYQIANKGDAKAQYILGLLLEEGRGIQQDLEKAIEWYTKSAENGYANAQYSLGSLYY